MGQSTPVSLQISKSILVARVRILGSPPTSFLVSFSDPRAHAELELWAQFPTPNLGSFSDPNFGVVFRPSLPRRIRIYIVERKLVPFSDPNFGVGKRHQIWGRKLSQEFQFGARSGGQKPLQRSGRGLGCAQASREKSRARLALGARAATWRARRTAKSARSRPAGVRVTPSRVRRVYVHAVVQHRAGRAPFYERSWPSQLLRKVFRASRSSLRRFGTQATRSRGSLGASSTAAVEPVRGGRVSSVEPVSGAGCVYTRPPCEPRQADCDGMRST